MVDRSRELATRAAVLVFLAFVAAPAWSAPRPVAAKVVWAKEARAYVAPLDTTSLELGSLVTLVDRKRTVASGDVIAVQAGELVVVRLTAGSLRKVKHLDRLTILAERPLLAALPLLRMGMPSRHRSSLFVRCPEASVVPGPFDHRRAERINDGEARVLPLVETARVWPETLLVRLFDDATDEEIALERGEIDIAMFWPGELSTHLRDDPRWQTVFGTRSWGHVEGQWREEHPPAGAVRAAEIELESMNQQLFRGDLAPLRETGGSTSDSSAASPPGSVRIVVDPSVPGQRTLQRFFNRSQPGGSDPSPVLSLSYTPAPPPIAAAPVAPRSGATSPDSMPLFAIRCPIVCGRDVAPLVQGGADTFVNFLDCGGQEGWSR